MKAKSPGHGLAATRGEAVLGAAGLHAVLIAGA